MRKPDFGEITCPWCKHDLVEHELNVTRALGNPGQPPPASNLWDYEATRVQLGACGRPACECRGTHPSNILKFDLELKPYGSEPARAPSEADRASMRWIRELAAQAEAELRAQIDRRAGEELREQLRGPGVYP